MSSSEKQHSKSADGLIDAGLAEEQLLQLRSAFGHAETEYLAGTSFEKSAARSEVADSGLSPLSSRPADLEGDNLFAFYPSSTDPFDANRPSLVDAVLEQLRQARLGRHRPH